jgi:hypothetical protein
MGQVIQLRDWQDRRRAEPARPPVVLLEQAVGRLDPAVTRIAAAGPVDPRVETELLAITGAVAAGDTDEALRRARRLADRLEHPSARPRG